MAKSFVEILREMDAQSRATQAKLDQDAADKKEERRQFRAYKRDLIRELGGAIPPDDRIQEVRRRQLSIKDAAQDIRHPSLIE